MFTTDGSDLIYVVDENFKILDKKYITTMSGSKQYYINELEYVDGYIYANIYLDHIVVKIDYEKGQVVKQYDGSQLIDAEKAANPHLKRDEVFNGLAYDEGGDVFIMTGKKWTQFFQVDL